MKLVSVRIKEKWRRSVVNKIRNGNGNSKYMKGIGRELKLREREERERDLGMNEKR